MSKFRVVVTDSVFPNLDPERDVLGAIGAEVVLEQCKTEDDLLRLVPGADAMLNTYYGPIHGTVMDAMPDCRIIVRYGIGVDTINIADATARGIMVANVPDYCIAEVSDHAVGMLLSLFRKLHHADRDIRAGTYSLAPLKPMTRVSSTTVGIIGFGRIGREIARKLAAFGTRVVFHDPYCDGVDTAGAQRVGLDELYRISDGIILQAPANDETRHMLNAAAFAAMEQHPVIVNCARGELIDTAALIGALRDGQVSGAALDVVEGTPPIENLGELLQFRSVIVTPHSAWFSTEALVALQRLAAMEVARALQGERPKSLLNPEVLDGVVA